MSAIRGQQQTFLRLLAALRPHLRGEPTLPARIQTLLARHKEFGSRDRRLYRELLYTTIRYLPWIEPALDTDQARAVKIVAWLAAETRDTAAFRTTLAGDWPAAPTLIERARFLGADTALLLPDWVALECPAALEPNQLESLLTRASLWLRLQTDEAGRVAADFEARGWHWKASGLLPNAWKLLVEADVTKSSSFEAGAVEIQDLGSQLVLESIGINSGGHWLDACAGAGGKTLQLARLLGPSGTVDASDIRSAALDELVARACRAARRPLPRPGRSPREVRGIPGSAAIRVVQPLALQANGGALPPSSLTVAPDPASRATCGLDALSPGLPATPSTTLYDGVLVDAPCSGSGTWRRSPHLKWSTTRETLARHATLQLQLLEQHGARVRPGGRLVYATCSLARTENQDVVTRFLTGHPEFESAPFSRTHGFAADGPGLSILPAQHDTDGFFVASLRRR